MNKTVIRNFAIEARKKLIALVKDKAGLLGITSEGCSEPEQKGTGFEIYRTHAGTENRIFDREVKQRQSLINRIKEKGYDNVMEEAAYTWFNRIIAIRFMEINDYLPTRVRVLSSETKNKIEPDIVTQAPDIDLDFTDSEREKVYTLKAQNKLDELFGMLFIKQCNKLGEVLPELFEKVSDYTELLLNLSFTNQDGVIRMLVDNIDEGDFKEAVEIIGWMYQYYNTELKYDTFALLKKNVKIAKERIPAATQLFTPDWIVRYMVENSLGSLWLEHLQVENKPENNDKIDSLKSSWKYYLDEAEQEEDVQLQLSKLRESYKDLNPEHIKIIDPCMGSGHILVYAFDVLMDIYKSCGYSESDAAKFIVEKNIYGLEIDDRAYQLAYFAVMMKGRKYGRRFFTREIEPNLCSIQESNPVELELKNQGMELKDMVEYFIQGYTELEKYKLKEDLLYLINVFIDAKEYGSILNVNKIDFNLIENRINKIESEATFNMFSMQYRKIILDNIVPLVKQGKIIALKYDAVVTNPPYMGSKGMSPKLSNYVRSYYADSKSDMFSVFIEKCRQFTKLSCFYAMITQPSILFLSSFEKLRSKLITEQTINSLLHMGRGIFGIDFGSTAFVIRNCNVDNLSGSYFRLHERTFQYIDPKDIEKLFLNAKADHKSRFNFSSYVTNEDVEENNEEAPSNKELSIYFENRQKNFLKISNIPIAYWVSNRMLNTFNAKILSDISDLKVGLQTGDNNRFLRLWHELNINKCGFGYRSREEALKSKLKWFPYNKGGEFRKWYGNNEYLVNWELDGFEIRNFKDSNGKLRSRPQNTNYYFKESITWSFVSSVHFGVRYSPKGALFDVAGSSVFPNESDKYYLTGYLCSKLSFIYMGIQNPTLNFQVGNVASLPIIISEEKKPYIDKLVAHNISISKADWDSFETSWDFKKHPLIKFRQYKTLWGDPTIVDFKRNGSIELSYKAWEVFSDFQFSQLKSNEEEIDRIFIEIYGLLGELSPEEEDKDVTIHKADLGRDIRSFISYAVGCIFGRYSLDIDNLAYAGGSWENAMNGDKYKSFIPDIDNVIPITDEEYFEDDIVGLFVKFVKTVYGEETLEENLDFIAKALGNKGISSREVIRNYFVNDFYKDHLKVYQKRPIYWQFDSGKQDGFKALIYMHRYDMDTVGRVRVDYLHKTQVAIESAIKSGDYIIENTTNNIEKSKATKAKEKYIKQLAETRVYDEAMAYIAHQRIDIDLDDGVKVNYEKFQGIEVSSQGKKTQKIDLLTKI